MNTDEKLIKIDCKDPREHMPGAGAWIGMKKLTTKTTKTGRDLVRLGRR